MQQETRNRMGSCQTMKREKRTSPNQSDCDAYPILKQSPFLNELSWKAGDGTDLFVFSSSFRTYFIWFIFRQQKTRNRIGSFWTVKCAEKILPKSELLWCIPPSWSSPHFSINWAGRLGMGPISSYFRALSESTLLGSFIGNWRLAIVLEVAQPWSVLREFRQDQSYFDAYPHLEVVPIFQRIELEGWGWARSLCPF